jgi:hypothetical protein
LPNDLVEKYNIKSYLILYWLVDIQGFVANPKSGLKLVGMKWSMIRCVVTAHP